MVDERGEFTDAHDELRYNLIRAEFHLRRCIVLCAKTGGPTHSLVFKTLLRRAHGICQGLYLQEIQNNKKRKM